MSSADGGATFVVAGEAYDRYVGRYSAALATELLRFAGVERGTRLLDVGCGTGALTRIAADLLGEAQVAAVDASPPFVQAARARVPGADIRNATAEALPFSDGEFDAVLSQLVVNFMTSAELGVREMRRVTSPGGVVSACVWDYAGEMTMLRAFWDAALTLDPAAPDEGASMHWCSPGELAALWRGAGLADTRSGEIVATADYADFEDLWSPFLTGVGPGGAYVAALEPVRRETLRAAYHERLGSPAGPFRLSARAWSVAGRAPEPR